MNANTAAIIDRRNQTVNLEKTVQFPTAVIALSPPYWRGSTNSYVDAMRNTIS